MKKYDETIMQNEDLVQKSIIRDMSDGVMVIGLDGTIRYVNRAALDILEKEENELSGRKVITAFFDNSLNDSFCQTILDAVSDSSTAHYNLVNYYTEKDVRTIYVMTSFLHNDDKRVALIVMLNDMTHIENMRKRHTEQILGLMDSLVQALSKAIDERSHYTALHTQNMVKMGSAFLKWLEETDNPWKFDENKKQAFLMSVWLHDVGKLSVPLEVMDKATRLGQNMETIEQRFQRIHLLNKIALLENRISSDEWKAREDTHDTWLALIRRINTAGFISDEDQKAVEELSKQHYEEEDLTMQPLLTENEVRCLMIKKGTLTDEERAVMQNHVVVTGRILQKVEFPSDFAKVPEWAASHHELINGKGYPDHKQGAEISDEIRLLTILDIFEALTAKDRPYKKAIPIDRAWKILYSMADEGSLDKRIIDLFKQSEAYKVIL